METRYYHRYSGNFARLTYPYDADGKACGIDLPKYPYIYFASPSPDVKIKKIRIFGSQHVYQNVRLQMTKYFVAMLILWFSIAANTIPDNKLKRLQFMIQSLIKIGSAFQLLMLCKK